MRWFNNLKVSRKFWAVGAFLFPLIILLSATGAWGATQINSSFQDVRTNQIPAIYQTATIIQHIQNSQLKIAQLLLELDPHKANLDGTKIPGLISAARDNINQAQKGWETYSTLPAAPGAAPLIKQFDNDWKIWATEAESLLRLVEQKAPNLQETALSIFDELSNQNQNLENTLLNISTLNYKAALVKADDGVNISQIVILLVIITATLILLLNLGVGLLLARSISRPLANLKNVTKAIASGDLTQQVNLETHDEVGELGTTFNLTVQSLQSLVKQLHWQSQLISSATQELTSQAKTQVDGSSQQAQYITQATQSLQELNQTAEEIMRQAVNVNKMVALSVDQAQLVNGLSEQMATAQEQGRQTVAQTVTALQNLKEQLADIQNGQQALVEQSWVIRTVTGLIQNLAQETHLLALNAAIEAAGAGEFGTRFAVVAQQIKQLADRSMKATNDVRSTLEGIGTLVERTSAQAKESLDQAERAVVQSGHSDTTLLALSDLSEQVRVAAQEIMRQVEASANLATNIETSTRQQQFASQHMLQRMMEIEAVTAQNLSSIRQEETAIYQLSLTAQDLLESADTFKLVNV